MIGHQARLFAEAGYPTTIIAGRGEDPPYSGLIKKEILPLMDSEHPGVILLRRALENEELPKTFYSLRENLKNGLMQVLTPNDIVIAHNILTTHFNLMLTSAVHDLADKKIISRLIVWCHDISRYVNPGSGVPQQHGFPWDLLRTYRPDTTYVAVSSQRQLILSKVLEQNPNTIQMIPNGIDPKELLSLSDIGADLVDQYDLLSSDLILLMPIRITRAKNIEFAMQVGAELKKAGLRIRLIITGPPDPHVPDIDNYYSDLKILRNTLGLTDEVVFIYDGTSKYPAPFNISQNLVAELYRICDLVLMPSLREGFGLPVLEAGLTDKPIFATHMPIVDDLDSGQVYIIEQHTSPGEVANQIQKWASQDVSHNLRVRVRNNYIWSSIFSKMIEPLIKQNVQRPKVKGL